MTNKTAIITGGSRGIGLAVAQRLAADGYCIAVLSTRKIDEGALFPEIEAGRVLAVAGDISDRAGRERLLVETVSRFGRVDVLVNNAGVAPKVRADLLEMTEESWDRVISINMKGAMFLTQLVAKQMMSQPAEGKKRGTIINISSVSAYTSSISRGEYCVSKAGVSMLTRLYADRLAKEGIYVHEIRPGVIKTDMTGAVSEKYDALINDGIFPIARWGTPEDVASAVSAFCGDNFLYTTGNALDVDGGFHIRRL